MKLWDVLPRQMINALPDCVLTKASEIRLRIDANTRALIDGVWQFYPQYVPTAKHLADIVYHACEMSVYAHAEELAQGYLTVEEGVRIGICGRAALNGNTVSTITDFTSLVIRIARQINGCSAGIMYYVTNPLRSTLIVSKPSAGKTTMLRDIARTLSLGGYNCLVADERKEISAAYGSENVLALCDVMRAPKLHALTVGLRTLSPDVLICDELQQEEILLLNQAALCGVALFASLHADSIEQAFARSGLLPNLFERFCVLDTNPKVGTVKGVYDNSKRKLL